MRLQLYWAPECACTTRYLGFRGTSKSLLNYIALLFLTPSIGIVISTIQYHQIYKIDRCSTRYHGVDMISPIYQQEIPYVDLTNWSIWGRSRRGIVNRNFQRVYRCMFATYIRLERLNFPRGSISQPGHLQLLTFVAHLKTRRTMFCKMSRRVHFWHVQNTFNGSSGFLSH